MRPRGVFPAVQEAFDFVKKKLDNGTWHQGERLPSVRDLAKMAQVSKPTMIKAIALLRQQNLISAAKRHRMRAGSSGTVALKTQENLPQWQKKRMLLEKDILSGIFGYRGNLPPLKALQTRYGVCFTTMKKMTNAMVADGILMPKGKGYALPEMPARSFRHRIVFITPTGHFSQSSALNQERNRVINMFENECKRAGLEFEILEIDFYNSREGIVAVSKLANSEPGLGFILDVWWYEQVRRSYHDVLATLISYRRPLAILDELGEFDLPVQFVSNPLVQVYSIEGKRAGERMARYLLSLGHRSAVYLSTQHDATWSQLRYDGAAAQFARVGYEGGVHLVADTFDMPLEQTLAASGLSDDEIKAIIAIGRTPSQARDLESAWLSFRNRGASKLTGDARVDAELRKTFGALSAMVHQDLADDILETVCTATLTAVGARVFEMSLKPLFEKALAFHDATAWMCANDGTALTALSYLRKRNVSVPKELSVVGFDNAPVEALRQRLTTFDFNASAFISQMLSFFFRPPRPRGPYRHSIIEIEGIILERDSAAKPREEKRE